MEKFERGYDVVQAIRTYDSQIHPAKQWTSRLFYRIQNWLSPIEIPVGATDFRLISRKVRNVFQSSIREQNQFLLGLFHWVGFRQVTIEFVSPPRVAGDTKYRVLKLFTLSVTGITSFSKVPLRSAAVVGFIISALSVLYGLFAITVFANGFAKILEEYDVNGFGYSDYQRYPGYGVSLSSPQWVTLQANAVGLKPIWHQEKGWDDFQGVWATTLNG